MLKSIFSASLLLLALISHAQFSITGSIRDAKDKHPLPGATVQADGTSTSPVSTVADEFGWFRLDKLSVGEHSLQIKFLGYTDKIETVNIQSNIALEIILEEAPTMTDEVVISA